MVGRELVQIVDGMLRRSNEVVDVGCLSRCFDCNTDGEGRSTDLRVVRHAPKRRAGAGYLAISPIRHVLQRQVCAIDGRRLIPHGQPQTSQDGPEGEDHPSPDPHALFCFRRWHLALCSRIEGLGDVFWALWVRCECGRRVGAFWWGHLAMLVDG